jgi:CO/xanthine dehydrogenase Mo-binding subunit
MESVPLLQDIPYRSTLFAITIRSPVPRGRLLSIECPQLERSYTLITAKNIPGKNELADFPVPILASGEVSYLGEPVALLAGPDRAKLESYGAQCKVNIQEETPVFAAPASEPAADSGTESGAERESPDVSLAAGDGGEFREQAREQALGQSGQEQSGQEQEGQSGEESTAEQESAAPPKTPEAVPAHPGAPAESTAEPEVFAERGLDRGDVGAAFAGAAAVISGTYSTGIQEHAYGEAVGALVEYISGLPGTGEAEVQRIFVIHTATQWPYHVSRSAAQVLALEENQVITEASDPGLPMDGKIWYPSLVACQAALAAFLTRRNVRLLLNREEDFRFSPKRNASITKIQSALGEKGEILGTRIDLCVDLGAHAAFGQEILDQSCLGVLGIAGGGALSLKARAIRTNIPPQGPFEGFGRAQGSFAMERHSSRIADSLDLDPAEWWKNHSRKDPFWGPGSPSGNSGKAESRGEARAEAQVKTPEEAPIAPPQLLDTAAAMSDYYRKWGSYELLRRRRREDPPPARPEALRGIGIALGRQGNGFLHIDETGFAVEVTLNIDGSLEIHTSMKAGKDFIRIWSNIARETLGVEEDKVRVMSRNTALCPDSGPESLSRNITFLSSLVEQSCQAIRNQRFRDPLPITVREIPGGKDISAPGKPDPLPGKPGSLITLPNPASSSGWAAAVVEVVIEPYSYTPVVRGIWLAVDGGRILSEKAARQSLKLAGIQALGWASGEYLSYRGGAVDPPNFSNYGIPGPAEIPPIRVDFLPDNTAPRGIGELPFCCVPAAYIQAVSQAADHPFEKIPLLPGEIWEILKPGGPGAGGHGNSKPGTGEHGTGGTSAPAGKKEGQEEEPAP